MKTLVIVESPAKAKTIGKYLGDGYEVLPTIGHIRELPKKDAIDPSNNYEMTYIISPGKEDAIKKITASAKTCDTIVLATDPDREGEAIAWHVADILETKHQKKIAGKSIKRAVFYEISKEAVKKAMQSPGEIAMDMVLSQETRRALDRHFGFTLSPLLWRLFPSNNHSAGRVQSPALRLIVEREKEIEAFNPQEYWSIDAEIKQDSLFQVKLASFQGEAVKKFTFSSSNIVESVSKQLEEGCADGMLASLITKKPRTQNPKSPFRTSVLQQQASNKFGFTPKRTMQIAQSLYARDGGGLITYIRTDSIEIDQGKLPSIYSKISSLYGENYLEKRNFRNKKEAKNIQEAHGAIVPVDINIMPDEIKSQLNDDEIKLYSLIWERTIASQMKSAVFERTSIEFKPKANEDLAVFTFSDQELVFDGYLKATKEEVKNNPAPKLSEGEIMDFVGLIKEQHFTEPPPRYNDASMIKTLEEKGIGRPSTYADILSRLTDRQYITLKQKRYAPSDMGRLVSNFLNENFSNYISDEFTSMMENDLDAISNGQKSKKEVLDQFWSPLETGVSQTGEKVTRRDVNPQRLLGEDPDSGKPIFARMTKNGPAVQLGDIDIEEKLQWASLKESQSLFAITLEEACELFKKPEDNILGHHPETNEPIIARVARYGPTIQLGTTENGNKPRYVGVLPTDDISNITLERALDYLALPREIGKDPESAEPILITIGPYGPYFKKGSRNFRARKGIDPFNISLEEALENIAGSKGSGSLKTFDDSKVKIVAGRWGPYITNGSKNVSVPKGTEPESLELEECLALLEAAPKKKKRKKKK
ncbi:MAG: type I DNA topoisomerase [Gammaproteobacteria bacterium]|nr:type I DNA topoisomerase [Gammaproteobacteria bacterium]